MNAEWINALWGGVLIGISVSLMLLWNGRVTGISGIIYGLINRTAGDLGWRFSFVLGLIMGGLTLFTLKPEVFGRIPESINWTVPLAGALVGFGTVLGSGCTSGHGVCGISRMSIRSLTATLLFITSGVLSVSLFKALGVLP